MARYFVNVYEIRQSYGGPEEGGWWYDQREPLQSKSTKSLRIARKWLKKARQQIASLPNHYGEILIDHDFFDWNHECHDPNELGPGAWDGDGVFAFIEREPAFRNSRPHYE